MTGRETYLNISHSLGTKLENMHQARLIWDYKIRLEIDSESIPGKSGAGFFCLVIANDGQNLVLNFGINNEYTPEKLEAFNERLDKIIKDYNEQFQKLKHHGSL